MMSENKNLPTLSKEATAELLGDNLCFVIAFGGNGEVVQYFPNGVEIDPEKSPIGDPLQSICVSYKNTDANSCVPEAVQLMKAATYWCLKNGRWVQCPTPC